jgi:hypothetical protein
MFLGSRARMVRKADNLTHLLADLLDNEESLTFDNLTGLQVLWRR